MTLHFDYILLPHPYAHELFSKTEKWVSFTFKIMNADRKDVKTLVEFQANLFPILTWFIDNKNSLLHDQCPTIINDESIAKGIYKFYDTLDDSMTLEKVVDDIFEYRERHDIAFALRGTDFNNIIVGLKDNEYTISFYNQEDNWQYNIEDFDKFILHIEKIHSAELEAQD